MTGNHGAVVGRAGRRAAPRHQAVQRSRRRAAPRGGRQEIPELAGEALYDDYMQFEVEASLSLPKVVFVVDTAANSSKVWATPAATVLADIQPIFTGFHFTALLPLEKDTAVAALLKDLPPIQGHSFIGPEELMLMVKAQR